MWRLLAPPPLLANINQRWDTVLQVAYLEGAPPAIQATALPLPLMMLPAPTPFDAPACPCPLQRHHQWLPFQKQPKINNSRHGGHHYYLKRKTVAPLTPNQQAKGQTSLLQAKAAVM